MYKVEFAGITGAISNVLVGVHCQFLRLYVGASAGDLTVGGMRCGCCPGRDGDGLVRPSAASGDGRGV